MSPRRASTPDARYSSTSRVPSGIRTAISDARFPGSMLPKSPSRPSARAPTSVALCEQRPGRHPRRHAPRLGQLGEDAQVGHARQAVGAECHVDVHRVERFERRRPHAYVHVASRARDDCRADVRDLPEILAVELYAVDDRACGGRGTRARRDTERETCPARATPRSTRAAPGAACATAPFLEAGTRPPRETRPGGRLRWPSRNARPDRRGWP